jgi:hypothetical protein
MRPRSTLTVAVIGTTQTLAWASSYYLPAILANPIAAGLGVAASSGSARPDDRQGDRSPRRA